ncbi:ABC-2 transporter permease [Kineothrix sedimenti]|uniref:ABC-2 transporter permease n=1 Tax=Kineothrix sedimenti TaxID=3123317 RepID=A0ABZ3F208_9FIRM
MVKFYLDELAELLETPRHTDDSVSVSLGGQIALVGDAMVNTFGNIYQSLFWGYCFGFTLSISTVAFMYPILLKIGAEKNELILLLVCGFSIRIMLLTSFLLSLFNNGIKFSSLIDGITSVIISVLLFVLSYLLSVRIHRNKEF